ncbi:MAG: alpha-ketoacid dehydrogenase subunit beta [Ilumatobacteraceae bacterium]|jgi:pyruvate/2-oxoglutarate/acetoin dehydrogenase E1 component|nr:alpha-ketoacid dehydrogenase subunit beta [Actinomycetota bacterium]MDA3011486.1 alpha-ketoacid dehydrogenase subunit beta [Actinomycetota bacterium]MDA3024138.1 alpha-ketoacid dehydrogenase subunit beta [Actinomycetota bacterium]NBU54925.1 alpha-ketoacid dehydrogenase subunit beta [Acidimicrobiia bacterium]
MSEERKLAYVMAFNEAVSQAMEADPDVFCAGEDIGAFGGVFGTFGGLQAKFGTDRVVDTPISEQAIVGLGVGAAATGLRPIVDLMFMDFICVAMDQIVNQAAKLKYMFGGEATLPLTITTAGGGGLSAAAQHSQSLEAILCHIPGLKVVYPSTPYDMKGLMMACIQEDNPTVMVKHKRLLGMSGHVPVEPYSIPLGTANVVRPGRDVTIVAYGRMVHESVAAAEKLAADGIECEIIDPRTLQPLDTDTIVASARRTNRVLVVHEAVRFGGLGAEIAAQIQEAAFDHLDAPVGRIGAPFSPVPFSPALEQHYIPSSAAIEAGVREAMFRNKVGA